MATSSPVFEREPIVVPDGTPLVEFRNVSIGFEDHEVLQDVSFSVARGETRIILGPAGGGKSTLMKLTNGLLEPDSGEIFALRAHVGMVFQESALFDSLDVEDNVAYRLHEDHIPETEVHERVVEALRFVELEKAIDKFPSELSGGMRRRVSIARAIITKPDLILYDSPTGGLDPITSTTIIELVVKQRDVSKATSLLITHRLQDAFALATHCWDPKTNHMEKIADGSLDPNTKFLVLNEGKVVFDGTTRELTHSQDPWLKAYLA